VSKRQPPSLMDRTRAAVGYINANARGRDSDLALEAFMALFHPEVPAEKVRDLKAAAKHNQRSKPR
jgi:hypothetical protein